MEPCNKVSIVIGGSNDVGFAVANELLRNNGKHVLITGKNLCQGEAALERLIETHGERCTFFKLDQLNTQQYEELFKKTNEHGGADILVNCEEVIRDKVWDYEIDLNLKGVIRGTLLGLKHMSKPDKSHGTVVLNLASTLGIDGYAYTPIYAGTKAGIIGFTRSIGDTIMYNETKLRVVALCPGVTTKEELDNLKDNQLNKKWGLRAYDGFECLPKQCPEHVARAVMYLIQNGQTGSVWTVEGGQLSRIHIPERKVISEVVDCVA